MTPPTSSSLIDPISRRRLPAYLLGHAGLTRWYWRGACHDEDTELFFPQGRFQEVEAEPARKICGACPVSTECREHADTLPEPYGIWAGTTPRERGWDKYGRRLKKKAQPNVGSNGAGATSTEAAPTESGGLPPTS
ncbi:WhiB family transcriptional regulator [Streptomyces sp. NPDC003038]|uniref:WhiB family transcriptional regulator n=1 Tax=unclassified Streptomyces TaxID=2593676 RepID=UPI0033B40E20